MNHLLSRSLLTLACFTLPLLTACKKAEEPQQASAPRVEAAAPESWEKFVTRQIEAHISNHPQWAVFQGRHEYDGQLPDWSRAGIEKEIARLHQVRDEAMAFDEGQVSA